jgi:hypothetical protein
LRTEYLKILFVILFIFSLLQLSLSYPLQDTTKHRDTSKINTSAGKHSNPDSSLKNQIQIDTSKSINAIDTSRNSNLNIIDSLYKTVKDKDNLTNTKLFLYIILSIVGIFLYFFLFVQTLFKIFHKTKSTRQSMLLSWNLFFIVCIIWLFIVWGLLAGFWSSSAFLTVIIFLFVISLIMTITAIKSR